MSNKNHEERAREMPAVKTTIVGGRPPGPGQEIGDIPHGMEILIKKAAVDPEFRELLLAKRAEAAKELELDLEPAEAAMLNAVPAEQLEAIIANTKVSDEARRALLGKVAGVTLAALGGAYLLYSCAPTLGIRPQPRGIRPDSVRTAGISPVSPVATQATRLDQEQDSNAPANQPAPPATSEPSAPATRGIRPDRPATNVNDPRQNPPTTTGPYPPSSRRVSPDRPRR